MRKTMKRSRSPPPPNLGKPTTGEERTNDNKFSGTYNDTDAYSSASSTLDVKVKRVRFDDNNNQYSEVLYDTTMNSSEDDTVSSSWYTNAEYRIIRSNVTETLILYRQQQQQLKHHQQQFAQKPTGNDDSAGVEAALDRDLSCTTVNIQTLTPPRNLRLPQSPEPQPEQEHPQSDRAKTVSTTMNTTIDPDDENLCIRGIEQYVSSDIAQGKYQRRSIHRRLTILKHRLQRKQQQPESNSLNHRLVDEQTIHLEASAAEDSEQIQSIQPQAIVTNAHKNPHCVDGNHCQSSLFPKPGKADRDSLTKMGTDATMFCPNTAASTAQILKGTTTSSTAGTSSQLEVSSAELIFSTLEIEKAYIMGLHDANEAYKVHIAESIASTLPSSINTNKT